LSSALIESNEEKKCLQLEEPSSLSEIPLSQQIDSFIERKSQPYFKESVEINKGCPPYLTEPFTFFGCYVALNQKEKLSLAEN
jgi:hypothetical protein